MYIPTLLCWGGLGGVTEMQFSLPSHHYLLCLDWLFFMGWLLHSSFYNIFFFLSERVWGSWRDSQGFSHPQIPVIRACRMHAIPCFAVWTKSNISWKADGLMVKRLKALLNMCVRCNWLWIWWYLSVLWKKTTEVGPSPCHPYSIPVWNSLTDCQFINWPQSVGQRTEVHGW